MVIVGFKLWDYTFYYYCGEHIVVMVLWIAFDIGFATLKQIHPDTKGPLALSR